MSISPFRISPSRGVAVEFSTEPVYSALVSLSFLNAPGQYPGEAWLAETAAALTPEQRRRNRLVFEGLGGALVGGRTADDFPSYVDGLAEDPLALRDRVLRPLVEPVDGEAPLDAARLLADREAFLAAVQRLAEGEPVDLELYGEVQALLSDPAALAALLVGHLRELWEEHLRPEWSRCRPGLELLACRLREREWPAASAGEVIRAVAGRDLPPDIAGQLEGVRRVVFVLSPHVGPWASRFGSDETIWVFIHARPGELPLRDVEASRESLLAALTALADETRLRILELVARKEELPAQEIIAGLGLSQSNISRHLKQLAAARFLSERRGAGAAKSYRLNRSRAKWTFRALDQLLAGQGLTSEPEDMRRGLPPELARFLDAEGRVTRWTKKRQDQMLLLGYLIEGIEPGREYSEAEVNAALNRRHTFGDPAILRRTMYNEGMLGRTADGSRYWRPARDGR